MYRPSNLLLSLIVALFAGLPASALQSSKQSPPGLKLVKGGSTKVGLTNKEVKRMLEEDESIRRWATALNNSTPQHRVPITNFFLMTTEVTNEQYAVHVRATGAKPPENWGETALNKAQAAFVEELGRKKDEAKKNGEPIPPDESFPRSRWWAKNWKGQPWAIPDGAEQRPVVYVNYREAQDYARWAGLRLPTEFEFQRASRGDTTRHFPWGSDWEDGACSTTAMRGMNQAFPVGSFPSGATEEGLHDLAGNVFEWTSSPFVAYPKWKAKTFKLGKGGNRDVYEAIAKWDPDKRVSTGGCFQTGKLAAMLTTRRGTDRRESRNGLGFRCAASSTIGLDMANTVLREDLPPAVRPSTVDGPVVFDVNLTLAMDSWTTVEPGSESQGMAAEPALRSPLREAAAQSAATIPPDGYAVIESYNYILFTGVEMMPAAQKSDLVKKTLTDGPMYMGFFSTNQTILEPALAPGSYMIAYRAAGETKAPPKPEEAADPDPADGSNGNAGQDGESAESDAGEPSLEEILQMDIEQDNLIFFDNEGEPLLAYPLVNALEYAKIKPGIISNFERTIQVPIQGAKEGDEDAFEDVTEHWLKFRTSIPGRASGRAFFFELEFKVDPELLGRSWRMAN